MKEKKNGIEITITCDNKEQLNNVAEFIRNAIIKGELMTKDDSDEPEPKAFQPKEGDFCTCVVGDNIDAIFRYDGKTHTDEDGNVWLDGNLGLTWSGDLFKPYMVIYGEDAEYERDSCRLASEEEIKFFNAKVKEFEEYKRDAAWVARKGDTYFTPSFDYEDGIFEPVKTTWEGKSMEVHTKQRGWTFRTEEECQPLCNKLNEAIKNVK